MNTQNPGANSEYHNNQPMQQQQGGYQPQPQPMTQGQYPEGQYPPQYTQGQPQQQQTPLTQTMPQQQQHFEGPQQGSHVEPNKGAAEMYSPSHTPAPPQ